MDWFAVIAFAILVEGIVEYFKLAFPRFGESQFIIPATVLLGVAVCILYGCDLLAVMSLVTPVPYVGNVLTGILVARGSNYIYDVIGKFIDAGGGA
ncbi:MAG: hypothetical protein IJP01_06485 [Oscillospiraceae bacterium]|nr:hypothetical protein [Oscillospiraceae bacterium]